LAVDQAAREERAQLDRQWREQLQWLAYEAELAQRRYELVDPANRLVALTLDTAWNDRLTARAAARAGLPGLAVVIGSTRSDHDGPPGHGATLRCRSPQADCGAHPAPA